MRSQNRLLPFYFFLALFMAAPLAARIETERPPNIILLLADDLGWNGIGCYGSDFHETPNLDRLAARGTKFLDAYAACTVCSPTRAAAMTGIYPARLHVTNWIPGTKMPKAKLSPPDWTLYLEQRHATIAEVLRDGGYKTAHVGKWHLGGEGSLPENHGFDIDIGGTDRGSPPGGYFLPNNLDLPGAKEGEYLTDHLTKQALKLIDDWKEEAFFLYFAYYNVHTPIQGRADLVERYKEKLEAGPTPEQHTNPVYAAMTHSLDQSVGRIIQRLKKLGLDDNTVVIFSSDNGGLSHKGGNPTGITRNDPLRRGKGAAFEGGTRVPLIVKWPGVTPAGGICTEPVSTVDFYPTILDIVDIQGDPGHNANVDGISLVPVLEAPGASLGRDALFWHFPHYHAGGDSPYGAVRAGNWKLIEFYEEMDTELYHLKRDLSESKNVADQHPEKVARLRKQLHAWRDSVAAQMPVPNPDYDPENAREGAPKSLKGKKAKEKKTPQP